MKLKVVESKRYPKLRKDMKFKPEKTAFGRHESFALRYGWLTKGFQAFEQSKDPPAERVALSLPCHCKNKVVN